MSRSSRWRANRPQRSSTPTPARSAGRTTATTNSPAALYVCGHCGYHFRMPARARIAWFADRRLVRRARGELRSADPLAFFDLRPYRERLAEAELNTGLPEAIIVGSRRSTTIRSSSR